MKKKGKMKGKEATLRWFIGQIRRIRKDAEWAGNHRLDDTLDREKPTRCASGERRFIGGSALKDTVVLEADRSLGRRNSRKRTESA